MSNKYLLSITLIILLLLKASYGIGQSFNEVIKVVASDREFSDEYGFSVSISGDYAIVGAFREDEDLNDANFASEAGSAYILEKDGSGNWVEVQKIVASDRAAADQFGYSVAISGNYVVVGARKEFVERGAAYIFERDGSGQWLEVEKISASDQQSSDLFGSSVAIGGNYVIVGAHQGNRDAASANSLLNAGSAYVFERDGSGNWSQTQKLVPSDRAIGDLFGFSVAMSGTNAIIGAYAEDEDEDELNTLSSAGSVYIFNRDGTGTYSEVSKHTASDRATDDQYGYSVAMYSTYAIVGANKESEDADGLNTAIEAGSAYILERDGTGTWAEVQKVVASDRAASDEFGHSVAISSSYAIVGASKEQNSAGAAYVFDRNDTGEWRHLQKRVSSDRVNGDKFGVSVSMDGFNIIAGANNEDHDENGSNNQASAGSAYLFEFENNRPVFTSSNTISIPENIGSGSVVLDVEANNDDGGASDERITYTIAVRNEDDLLFDIDEENGQVTIDFSPDFENPSDHNTDNVYFLQINANDGLSSTNQFVFITVTDVDEIDPIITSSATASVIENSTGVAYSATADETVTFTLGSTKDEGLFSVANGNEISFSVSPDFENPQDGNIDNAYLIDVIAEDAAGNTATLAVTITVTDADEFIVWDGSVWSNGTGPSDVENVKISGDYAGGFECANLEILSFNTMTVSGGSTLEVNGMLTNNGTLIIESGSSLITYASSAFAGNAVTIKRNTRYTDGKYSFVGTPVEQNASMTGSDLGTSVFKYNEVVDFDTDGINRWEDASADQLIPGKGYTQANQQEIIFSAVPNVGTITYSGTYTEDTNDANEGWNLVANPYAAAILVADFITENDNTTGSVYFWDDNGSDSQRGTNSDYIVANGSMATNTTPAGGHTRYNNHLGSTQGFFVKLNDNTDTDILFTENMRRGAFNSDANFFRSTQLPIVRINLTNAEGLFKQAVVGFAEDAAVDQINRKYDALAFNTSSDDGLFTLKAGRTLALNGMPNDWESIQLQFNNEEAGIYQISMEKEAFNQSVFLRDNLTKAIIDLSQTDYSFSSKPGIHTDRFELLANPSGVLGLEQNELLVYAIEHTLHISQKENQKREYQLFNMNGKQLLTTIAEGKVEVDLSKLPSGVFLVFDGQKTHKIILN